MNDVIDNPDTCRHGKDPNECATCDLMSATKEIGKLRELCAVLVGAINGVIKVADRKTDEFDAAREALAAAAEAGIGGG